ncbi:MAG: glycosyltransferase family 2 protein [Sulfitobacter sp.]
MRNTGPEKHLEIVISIINYRTAELTIACVQSVLDDLSGIAARIVVVDNNSGDGSARVIADWIGTLPADAPVSLILSPTNSGFSGGHNQGIGAHRADYYLVLNSDAILRPGCLAALLETARSKPDIGLFAPRLEYDDGTRQTSCFRFPSPLSEVIRGACSGPVTKLLKRYDIPLDMPPAPDQIDWASFACIMLSGRMIDALGTLDQGYFMYFEDIEYCWRARKAGWRIIYVPQARAVHYRGGSGPVQQGVRENARLPAYYYASRTRFFYQAYSRVGVFAANGCWLLGRSFANLRRLVGKPVPKTNQSEPKDIWTNALSPLGDWRAEGNEQGQLTNGTS